MLLLSHGQATVERGFSINKEVEENNLQEGTLIAKRLVIDHIQAAGGVGRVEVTSKMIVSAGSAHNRYKEYLEQEREKKEKEQRGLKRKNIDSELEQLSARKNGHYQPYLLS